MVGCKKIDDLVNSIIPDQSLPNILLTLSPFTDNLMGDTWDAIYQTQYKYNWFIRLHPSMLDKTEAIKTFLLEQGIKRFEIEKSSFLPLYSLLRRFECHITSQSTCVIEAADFGIISLITSKYGSGLFKEQIKAGKAYECICLNDILEKIKLSVANRTKFAGSKSSYNALSVITSILQK